jgi:hypothetical protein
LPGLRIPADWTFHWDHKGLTDPPEGRVNTADVGQQLRLLNLMTEDSRKPAPTRIRRSTYLMLNALKGIGDFGVHLDNDFPSKGFAIVIGFLIVELVELLSVDLAAAPV